jgi:hypothetical protein
MPIEDTPATHKMKTSFWMAEIKRGRYQSWEDEVKRIVATYRNKRGDSQGAELLNYFNIFWSNVETLKPAIYSAVPKMAIVPRNKNKDRIAMLAATSLERMTDYEIDTQDFDYSATNALVDLLQAGRGQVWERFEPEFDTEGQLTGMRTLTDFVHWSCFRHSPARTWDEVDWCARKHYFAEEEIYKYFPQEADKAVDNLKFENVPDGIETKGPTGHSNVKVYGKAEVWEVWDKPSQMVFYVSEGYVKPLKAVPVTLALKNFFPCPRPVYASTTTDTLEPIPDLFIYFKLASLLDVLTGRISELSLVLKTAGIYDSTLEGLQSIVSGNADVLVGVKNFSAIVSAGGVEGAISWFPLQQIAGALKALIEMQQQVKGWIFEISGQSDLMRGANDPRSTATAENLKGQFVSVRLRKRVAEFNRFLRDTLAIKAEIIAEQYPDNYFALVCGADLATDPDFPAALALLRQDLTRCYRIDIETDSTQALDDQTEKQRRTEFFDAFTAGMERLGTVTQTAPEFVPLFGEAMLFALRAFRVGRQVEDLAEQTIAGIVQQQRQQAQNGPAPDPEMMKMQAEMQFKQLVEQQKAEAEQAKIQLDNQKLQMDYAKAVKELEVKQEEIFAKAQQAKQDYELRIAELQTKTALEAEKTRSTMAIETLKLSQMPAQSETPSKESTPAVTVNLVQPRRKITRSLDAMGQPVYEQQDVMDEAGPRLGPGMG